jgi:DNA helicase-2/ATP-dependent DNA helicase PcrA
VLRFVRDGIGLGEAAAALDGARRRLDRSAHGDDLDALLALADLEPDPASFEPWLLDALAQPADRDGVRLATIHAVKGREWPHVVVHHVTDGLLPHRLVDDVEEERRVFHVAITRARTTATVVTGSPPSPFVAELAEPGEPPPVVVRPPRQTLVDTPKVAVDGPLLNALKSWRTSTARTIGKPAFTVFHDATLEAIAAARPTSLVQLGRVKGLGPTKLERWGDELLAVVDSAQP